MTREEILTFASQSRIRELCEELAAARKRIAEMREEMVTERCETYAANDQLAHAQTRIAELEAAGKVLVQFVIDTAGYGHDDDCPCDDTCNCSKKPLNDALNAACRVVESELKQQAPLEPLAGGLYFGRRYKPAKED